MDFSVLILIVVVILLFYYLYVNYIQVNASSHKKYDLNVGNTAIEKGSLSNSASTRYSYSLWIYVNSWSNTSKKSIISRGSDFKLTLDQTTPTLRCNLADQANSGTEKPSIVLTQNFPLQKWTYVIISVDNQIIDIYLDGKLVMSKKLDYIPKVSDNNIMIGEELKHDIFLTSVTYTPSPMDPQTAWNNYIKGNGMNNQYNVNLKLSILQDNIEHGKVSLF